MTEPMTDERLSELRHKAQKHITREVRTIPEWEAREMLAEIDRLRAELAARPEPIGYVVARPTENARWGAGPVIRHSASYTSLRAAQAGSADAGPPWRTYALVLAEQVAQ